MELSRSAPCSHAGRWLVAGVAVVTLGAAIASCREQRSIANPHELLTAANALPYRLADGRLSDAFEYHPVRPSSGPIDGTAEGRAVIKAAVALQKASLAKPTSETRRRAAVALLLAGE